MICRYCNTREAGQDTVCGGCSKKFLLDQCVAEMTGCIKHIQELPDELSEEHVANLILVRQRLGKLIDKYARRKKGYT